MADGSREVASPNAGLRAMAGNVKLGANGLAPQNLAELMDFAQLMAKAGPMVGKTFRENPGACLGIAMQAMQWGMNPFAVSQKAYTTGDNIGYEGQLVIAVINAHAPIQERLKPAYRGEGPTRQCIISATLKGETSPAIYESPEVSKITVKNSPLWKSDQDQQLFYYSARMWARRYCPEVIMGVYDVDEFATVETTVVSNERIDTPLTFISGAEKDALIEDWTARLRAATAPEDIEQIMAEAEEKRARLSSNAWDGLEHIAAQETERVCEGIPPRPPEPSPFEALKAEGLAVLTSADPKVAFAGWQAKARSRTKLALCSVNERAELKTLEKTIKADIELPHRRAEEGASAADGSRAS